MYIYTYTHIKICLYNVRDRLSPAPPSTLRLFVSRVQRS